MIMLAKIALGVVGTVAVTGAYAFRDGVVRVDVDEAGSGGSHVHLWAPAAAIPMAMRLVPQRELDRASREAREWMPVVRTLAREIGKLPDSVFVEVQDGDEHVRVSTVDGALKIDVTDHDEDVHVVCPLATIEDVTGQIAGVEPGA